MESNRADRVGMEKSITRVRETLYWQRSVVMNKIEIETSSTNFLIAEFVQVAVYPSFATVGSFDASASSVSVSLIAPKAHFMALKRLGLL